MIRGVLFMVILLALFPVGAASADSNALDAVTVMALGPADSRAVVRLSDGKMRVLDVGDTVPGTEAVVMQVLHDKLVVEDVVKKSTGAPERQTVWIYKARNSQERSRVQRLDATAPANNVLTRPSVGEGSLTAKDAKSAK